MKSASKLGVGLSSGTGRNLRVRLVMDDDETNSGVVFSQNSMGGDMTVSKWHTCRFVNRPINVDVSLVDENNSPVNWDVQTDLTYKLYYSREDDTPLQAVSSDIVKYSPSSAQKFNGKVEKISFTITKPSFDLEDRLFVLVVSSSAVDGLDVEDAVSDPFCTVNYILYVTTNTKETGKSHARSDKCIFYNQEDGQRNCIECGIELRNSAGVACGDRSGMLLRLILTYDKKPDPLSTSLYKVLPDMRSPLNEPRTPELEEGGFTKFRFKLNEVSTSHQKQLFVMSVGPDTMQNPLNGDVGWGRTTPVQVLSKRNKKHKQQQELESAFGIGEPRKRKSTTDSYLGSAAAQMLSGYSGVNNLLQLTQAPQVSTSDLRMDSSIANGLGIESALLMAPIAAPSAPLPSSRPNPVIPTQALAPLPITIAAKPEQSTSNDVLLNNINAWASKVYDSSSKLKWGQHTSKAGDDHYNMVCPNAILDDIMMEFQTHVRKSLEVLGSRLGVGSGSPRGGVIAGVTPRVGSGTGTGAGVKQEYGFDQAGIATRSNSNASTASQDVMQRSFSADMVSYLPDNFNLAFDKYTGASHNMHYVLCQKYDSSSFYFQSESLPVFDKAKKLVGFTTHEDGPRDDPWKNIHFIPHVSIVTNTEKVALEAALLKALRDKPDIVSSRENLTKRTAEQCEFKRLGADAWEKYTDQFYGAYSK
jgi:hypothetical protein